MVAPLLDAVARLPPDVALPLPSVAIVERLPDAIEPSMLVSSVEPSPSMLVSIVEPSSNAEPLPSVSSVEPSSDVEPLSSSVEPSSLMFETVELLVAIRS